MAEIKNMRFEVRMARAPWVPSDNLVELIIKGEIDGKTYSTGLSITCVNGEIPASKFTRGVEILQETMEQIAEEVQRGGVRLD